MEFIKDIFYINKTTMKKTLDLFLKNWLVIFTGLIYSMITLVAYVIASPFLSIPILNIVIGVLLYFLTVALISSYLYVLYSIVKCNKFELKDIKTGLRVYTYEVSRILFIGWIAGLLVFNFVLPIIVTSFGGTLEYTTLVNIVGLLVLIAINPLPEVIYQKNYTGLDGLRYTFNYMKDNWVEWLIPNAILLGLLYFITGSTITNLFPTGIGFNFNTISIQGIGLYLIGQVIFSFTMIYRGVLFNLLSTSNRRKRMFMRNTYR